MRHFPFTSNDMQQCERNDHPIQVAKYVIAQGIQHEPAFNWWVQHVLKKRGRITSMMKQHSTKYLKKNHELVLKLPNMVKEADSIDMKNENTIS